MSFIWILNTFLAGELGKMIVRCRDVALWLRIKLWKQEPSDIEMEQMVEKMQRWLHNQGPSKKWRFTKCGVFVTPDRAASPGITVHLQRLCGHEIKAYRGNPLQHTS